MKPSSRAIGSGMKAAGVAALLLVAACAQQPPKETPKPVAPQITQDTLRKRAVEQLAEGEKLYQAGEYDKAIASLQGSLDHGLLSREDQSRARKLMAFSHCVSNRDVQCRQEFRKAFEINPNFALTAAEDGHPIWGPVYRDVRTQLIAEREAASGVKRTALGKAEQMLADGMVKYDSGDYAAAHKLLEASVKEGLKEEADQVRALKHVAFSLCLQEKFRDCRAAFIRIYDVDPKFDLTPAEAGHPSWTRTFAGAKAQALRALKDKEVREAREKAKAPPAAAIKK